MTDIDDNARKEIRQIANNMDQEVERDGTEIEEKLKAIEKELNRTAKREKKKLKQATKEEKEIRKERKGQEKGELDIVSREAFLWSQVLVSKASLGLLDKNEIKRFENELGELERFAEEGHDKKSEGFLSRAQENVQIALEAAENNS